MQMKLDRKTGRYTQSITLKNADGAAAGPMSLILDSLSSHAWLFNTNGTTSCAIPTGSPYVNVDIGADGSLNPRERATVILEFSNPSGQAISYTPRVVTGAGAR